MSLFRKWYLLSLCLLASALQAAPEPSSTPASSTTARAGFSVGKSTAPDVEELTRLLRQFLAGASKNDLAAHQRFWADDLIYTSSSGQRMGKTDIIRDVTQEGPPKPGDETTDFTAEDIRIQQYDTTAIVAFRLVGITNKGDKKETAEY